MRTNPTYPAIQCDARSRLAPSFCARRTESDLATPGRAAGLQAAVVAAAALMSFVLLLHGSPARAQGGAPGYPEDITAYDPREVAMLPPYCIYTIPFRQKLPSGNDPEKVRYWESVMGPTVTGRPAHLFHTLHHYCWGLMKTNRATKLVRSKWHRNAYLNSSLDEFNFVLRHAPADFPLLPEIHTRKGENLLRLGRVAEGMRELERAIELKPDYWPPYVAISGHYESLGERDKARAALERGLSAAPDSEALKMRLRELNARN